MSTMTPRVVHGRPQSQRLELAEELRRHFPRGGAFDGILALPGTVYREHKNRRTSRVEIAGRAYFLKIHNPTPWGEILKNAARGRWPVLTSRQETAAIKRLSQLGVPTVRLVGSGTRGRWPAGLQSFIVTEALHRMVQLDDAARAWMELETPRRVRLQRTAIGELAAIARALHANGLNHRDFYLNHFLIEVRDWGLWMSGPLNMHLIDLHRMQIRRRTPRRWVIKDLAGLLFSSLDFGLTSRDLLRFLRAYWGEDWRQRVRRSGRFRRVIVRRALSLYQAERGKPPPLPGGLASFAGSARDRAAARAAMQR